MWRTFVMLWKMLGDPDEWLWEVISPGWHYRHKHTNLEFISYDEFVLFKGFDPASQANYFVYPWWMRQALSFRACRMRRGSRNKAIKLTRKKLRKEEYARIMNARLGVKQ